MAYSRWGRKIAFVRHVNDLFMKYSIPLALSAVVRAFADGVNAEFTYTQVIDLFAFRHHFTFRLFGKGLLLIDDSFYLHLTEGPTYETN